MKKGLIVIILMLIVSNAYAETTANWSGNLNLLLGRKNLDKSDWEPVEKQAEFGILLDFKQKDWPVSIAIDLLGSSRKARFVDTGMEATGSTGEFAVGIRKMWEPTAYLRPFIGGGIASVSGEFEIRDGSTSIKGDDNTTGLWLNGGVFVIIGQHLNVGLSVRYSKATIEIFDIKGEAGGTHTGLFVGYHW